MNPPLQAGNASSTPETSQDEEASVRADTMALLFDQSFPAVFQSLFIAGMLVWALWERVDTTQLLIWLAVLAASTFLRMAMYWAYYRAKPAGKAVLGWGMPYWATLALSSLIWGLGMVWLMPPQDIDGQFIILFFLAGMVGGISYTYSAHRVITLSVIFMLLLPCTIWLFFQASKVTFVLGLGASIFMFAAIRGTKVLSTAMQNSLRLSYQLKHANEVAVRLAYTDALTGIHNRRSFMELGDQMIRLCHRQARPLCALVLDVDHFKQINDIHGHSAGDFVLKEMGTLLSQQFRAADVCGRIGGEEFAVLLADTDTPTAITIAEKFRQTLADARLQWNGQTLQVTVSIGVASHQDDLRALLQRADAAMYQAKTGGRNRVVCQTSSD